MLLYQIKKDTISSRTEIHKGSCMIPEKLAKHCRDKSMAVMFCYFNQIQYFKEYLDCYEGDCVILIGPVN